MKHDPDNTMFIGIRAGEEDSGFVARLYDADTNRDLQVSHITYATEREALAEAVGWANADEIPLDGYALKLSRQLVCNPRDEVEEIPSSRRSRERAERIAFGL